MQNKTIFLYTFFLFIIASTLQASLSNEFFPQSLIQLDPYFNHHVIIAEKSTHTLHLYENQEGYPAHVKSYVMATGKKKGDKKVAGDHKTPEGIYTIRSFLSEQLLLNRYGKEGEIYGSGAFTLDYPNPIDKMNQKTGGGIWLHSTNDESRIQKGLDSRGCVVVSNRDIKEISKYIEIDKTTFIIVEKISYLKKDLWLQERKGLNGFLSDWLSAWKSEDLNKYISAYSSENFYSPIKGSLRNYKQYKKAVFWRKGRPDIQMSHISIFKVGKHYRVRFIQDYKSSNINDSGVKTLYLEMSPNYQWKIIRERWSKLNNPKVAWQNAPLIYTPKMRFFSKETHKDNN